MLIVSFYTFLFLPLLPVFAEEADPLSGPEFSAPVIQHTPPHLPIRSGEPLTITATITSKNGLKEALLFYTSGEGKGDVYKSIRMEESGENLYKGVIPAGEIAKPQIKYYFKATDKMDNMTMRGFPTPIVASVSDSAEGGGPLMAEGNQIGSEGAGGSGETAVSAEKPWYKKWWVWGVAGAVILGAAAAGGGGGGGGGTGAGSPAPGTVTISGKTP